MQKMIGQFGGHTETIGFQTIKQPDSARRDNEKSLTTAKAISKRG